MVKIITNFILDRERHPLKLNLLLEICSERDEVKDSCAQMFIIAVFIIDKC